jgi:aminopeptidase N
MSQEPSEIFLKDYQAPGYLIESTDMHFELHEQDTLVRTRMQVMANVEGSAAATFELFGHEDVELCRIAINDQVLSEKDYQREGEKLIIKNVPASFLCETLTRIQPQDNTALEGLYKSDGMFCTQCEAEGFRRITFYPDRPDVMSVFRTTVEADKALYPVLLSNGNPVEQGEGDDGRHWITW